MIDIDEYIGMWDDNLLGSEGVNDLMSALIAEVKRLREELDEANKIEEALWDTIDNWDICMDDYSMHDLYNNLDEKYARDDEGRIILKELYTYTEEDGWLSNEELEGEEE